MKINTKLKFTQKMESKSKYSCFKNFRGDEILDIFKCILKCPFHVTEKVAISNYDAQLN